VKLHFTNSKKTRENIWFTEKLVTKYQIQGAWYPYPLTTPMTTLATLDSRNSAPKNAFDKCEVFFQATKFQHTRSSSTYH